MLISNIIFYGLLYRIGLIFIKKQVYEKHIIEICEHNPISSNIEFSISFLEEFYRIFLLIHITKRKTSGHNQAIFFLIRTTLALISYFIENPLSDFKTKPHYVFGVVFDEFLKTLILCFSVQFIQEARGRMAGFLDLMLSILETFFMWWSRTIVIGEVGSSFLIVLIYIYLNPDFYQQIWKMFRLKNFFYLVKLDEILIFLGLGLFKFLTARNIKTFYHEPVKESELASILYYGPLLLDDIVSDVFFTAFIYCYLFMKDDPVLKKLSMKVMSNTIILFWGTGYISFCIYYSGIYVIYYKVVGILISTSVLSTIKSVTEFLYIYIYVVQNQNEDRKDVTNNLIRFKFLTSLLYLLIQIFLEESLVIYQMLLFNFYNLISIFYYLYHSDNDMIDDIVFPDKKLVMSLFFCSFITIF